MYVRWYGIYIMCECQGSPLAALNCQKRKVSNVNSQYGLTWVTEVIIFCFWFLAVAYKKFCNNMMNPSINADNKKMK